MHKIVHFDLKGAPPNLSYFKQVLQKIKSWGATGVLLEWEDTFPYSSFLEHIGSLQNNGGDNVYSVNEVQEIFDICKELGLEVIQLVQTMGHMEFVLKHSCYEELREYDRSYAALCPSKPGSQELVRAMVMQALDVQPDANYFHIGADEVWHIGMCEDCRKRIIQTPQDVWRLYLEHVRDVALFIKDKRPNITILMWDDMLRTITVDIMREFELGDIVQPVVWNYLPKENFFFRDDMWGTYKQIFPAVWAGSAYKGANGSSTQVSPVARYVSNHEAWMSLMDKLSPDISFAGVILTGWSRYDHFATLCEVLPASLNSLANCLKSLTTALDCFEDLYADKSLPASEWPGIGVHTCMKALETMREKYFGIMYGEMRMTYMNEWQLYSGFINGLRVESIGEAAFALTKEIKSVETVVTDQFSRILGKRSTNEWIHTYIFPMYKGLAEIQHTVGIIKRGAYPRFTPSVA